MDEKLAIFDLDGTIWKENSHTDIVDKYYGIKANSLLMKLYRHMLPDIYMKWLNYKFDKIPSLYIQKYKPTLNMQVIDLIKEYQKEGWKCIIISNAPQRIVDMAEKRFLIKAYHGAISNKSQILKRMNYAKLNVITDNISDYDLIAKADYSIIIMTEYNKRYFIKKKAKINNMKLWNLNSNS